MNQTHRWWVIIPALGLFLLCHQIHAAETLEQFMYLENQLIKDRKEIAPSSEKISVVKYGASVALSFVLSKVLEYVVWDRIEKPWLRYGITFLTPGASNYEDACQRINMVLFAAMGPIFMYMISVFYKENGSAAATIESFIKQWPLHKKYTPERFCEMFAAMHVYYTKRKALLLSETSAQMLLMEIDRMIVEFMAGANKKNENDIERYQHLLDTFALPPQVAIEIKKEIAQLKNIFSESPEATMLKNHIEWVLSLPWARYTQENSDIKKAKNILDHHHYGLTKVKERIIDFLAVRALSKKSRMPILCLAGPPGIGKTSIGQSIAQCVGKKFFRLSLGGLNDEAEIRGHRRTYVGSMPGRLMQTIRKAEACNPLILLDEIDKIDPNSKGDPAAALLEVLDPGQNAHFYDNYIGVPFDLSQVLFIATANDISKIPGPLRDRMEVIVLPGYTIEEKLEIAKRHVIPAAVADAGLRGKGFVLNEDLLMFIIATYANEPGMRGLERCVYTLCARFARVFLEQGVALQFDKQNIAALLAEG